MHARARLRLVRWLLVAIFCGSLQFVLCGCAVRLHTPTHTATVHPADLDACGYHTQFYTTVTGSHVYGYHRLPAVLRFYYTPRLPRLHGCLHCTFCNLAVYGSTFTRLRVTATTPRLVTYGSGSGYYGWLVTTFYHVTSLHVYGSGLLRFTVAFWLHTRFTLRTFTVTGYLHRYWLTHWIYAVTRSVTHTAPLQLRARWLRFTRALRLRPVTVLRTPTYVHYWFGFTLFWFVHGWLLQFVVAGCAGYGYVTLRALRSPPLFTTAVTTHHTTFAVGSHTRYTPLRSHYGYWFTPRLIYPTLRLRLPFRLCTVTFTCGCAFTFGSHTACRSRLHTFCTRTVHAVTLRWILRTVARLRLPHYLYRSVPTCLRLPFAAVTVCLRSFSYRFFTHACPACRCSCRSAVT